MTTLRDAILALPLPGPDLWRESDSLQGYTAKPGSGPWFNEEQVRALLQSAAALVAAEAGTGGEPLSARERTELIQWCDRMSMDGECGLYWKSQFKRMVAALRADAREERT